MQRQGGIVPEGRILVTGGSGFIGSALIEKLSHFERLSLRVALRRSAVHPPVRGDGAIVIDDIGPDTAWREALAGVDHIVHLAGRVHVSTDAVPDAALEYHRINVLGTLNLARQAAAARVRRFVFISSVKVNGEETLPDAPFRADDAPAPADAYAASKREAEDALQQLAAETDMQIVVIRPPLVYGPGVKANFLRMMRWLRSGMPLPFGAVQNKRSLIFVDNLVDLLVTCIAHPAAANQVFLASDGEDLSTAELLRRTGIALGRPARLFAVPPPLLTTVASLVGKADLARRLCGSLQVDISKTRDLMDWVPPFSVDNGLRATARHYLYVAGRY